MRFSKVAIYFYVPFVVLKETFGECPNACSGHGQCGSFDMCTCERNWQGADCSLRTCPFGLAHVDTPKGDLDASNTITNNVLLVGSNVYPSGTAESFPAMLDTSGGTVTNSAHDYMECSNKGLCDRSTGECECLPGYDGAACQRASCPSKTALSGVSNVNRNVLSVTTSSSKNFIGRSAFSGKSSTVPQIDECSGHGTCETIAEIANLENQNIYTLWDKDSTMGCKCDAGYDGPDCSERMCKYGIDPLYTDDTTTRVTQTNVRISTSVSDTLGGQYAIRFYDKFGEKYLTEPLSIDGDGSINSVDHCVDVVAALKALPNGVIPDVSCTQTVIPTNKGVEYTLKFFANPGKLKELEINQYLDGDRPTLTVTSGSYEIGVYTKVLGEDIDYFATRCENLQVKVIADSADSDNSWNTDVRPGSIGYLSGLLAPLTDSEKKTLKKCLGDSDWTSDNNIDVQNWDKGATVETDGAASYNMIGAFPHAIKIVPKETNPGYTKYSQGSYHLLWYDDSATNKEFRVANIDHNHNLLSEANDYESFVYTTKGVVQQMGWGPEANAQIAVNSDSLSTSTRIVGYFDKYTNKIFTNYDTSCENQPTSGSKNFVCVEKGAKLFVVDGCWGAGDLGAGTSNPFFGGPDVFNCADSTEPMSNTGNIYTVTKVYTVPIGPNSGTSPSTTVDATSDPSLKHYIDTFIIEVDANLGWEGVHGDPENSNLTPPPNRDDTWSDNTGVVTLFHFTPSSEGNFEYVSQCGNRGLCDNNSGLCQCFKGYTGDDCTIQNVLAM